MDRLPDYDHLLRKRPDGAVLRELERQQTLQRKLARIGRDHEHDPVLPEHLHQVYVNFPLWLAESTGSVDADVGTSYADIDFGFGSGTLTAKRYVDFSLFLAAQMRVYASASGNEAGSKSVAITTDANVVLCDVSWSGTSHGYRVGSWTDVNLRADTLIKGRWKGSSGTEDLTLYALSVEIVGWTMPMVQRPIS